MTRRFGFRALSGGILAMVMTTTGWAGVFGRVVPIGGNASDIALDESRGVLYIANFTANRIEVMNISDLTITRSINVNPQPGSIALSPNRRYLVIGHYYGNAADPVAPANALTILDLDANTRQTLALGNSPLGVAFGADGLALILTTAEFLLLDPASGSLRVLSTVSNAAKTLPVQTGTLPLEVTTGSLAASGDGLSIHGLTDTIQFIYDVQHQNLNVYSYTATPPLGPRLASASQDGSLAVVGWSVTDYRRFVTYDFPNPSGALGIGTHVVDSNQGVIYAQIPPPSPPPPPPASASACLPDGRCVTVTNAPSTTPAAATEPPTLQIVEADNLTVRERFRLAENLGGRSVLSATGDRMYSISESGVTVFPVGSALRTARRLAVSKEDVVFQTNSCDRRVTTQQINITNPGGGATGFGLRVLPAGAKISISQSSAVTPATVRISYSPLDFQNTKGTANIQVQVVTADGVNVHPTQPTLTNPALPINVAQVIRVLVNNHDTDQRGSVINIPGTLVDILPDNDRDRYYVLRQDKNQVLVFNAVTNSQTATLRTGNLPTQLAMTRDGKYLLVGSDSAQYISVFDLDTLQADDLIRMPFGHYPRSVGVSGRSILVASRVAGPKHLISKVDMATREASALSTLGIFENNINIDTMLLGSVNGSSILAAMADGTTMLYSSSADTFTVARKSTTGLSGIYGASSLDQFVIGTTIYNASLSPVAQLGGATGEVTAGFAFVDQLALQTSGVDPAGPGNIRRIDLNNVGVRLGSSRMAESPLFTPVAAATASPIGTTAAATTTAAGSSVFKRTLAVLPNQGTIVSLSQSGITLIPMTYDAPVPTPRLTSIVNAADRTQPVAPGGLISVTGRDLSMLNVATRQVPLPTALAESCLTVNGVTIPLVLVSNTQINAQLPFSAEGVAQMTLRTPGGVSDNLNFRIQSTAPSVFRTAGIASIVRSTNNEVVSDSNPVRPGDELTIFATGLGRTSPVVDDGDAAPSDPLAAAVMAPEVTLDGVPLSVKYAGLAPGEVGVYQINVTVSGVRQSASAPLTIRQGATETTLAVQVLE